MICLNISFLLTKSKTTNTIEIEKSERRKLTLKKIGIFILIVFLLGQISYMSGIPGFAANDELRVIVAPDLHFESAAYSGSIENVNNLPGSELYNHVRYNGQLLFESEAIIRSFLEKAAASDAECILVPGDLVNGGIKSCHLELAALFKSFEHQTGKQIYVSVGNHDCSSNTTMQEFESIYNEFGFSQALSRDEITLSYTADLGGGYRLLSVSSATYEEKASVIEPSTLQWIKEQCEAAKADGKKIVAITHYGLLQHAGFPVGDLIDIAADARIDNADEYSGLFADWGIKYIFTGHIHVNDISKAVSANKNEIYDIVTSALVGFPCTYRFVTFSGSGVEFKAHNIDIIDTSHLPGGFSAAKLSKITGDFQGYARGMVGASIQFMLRNFAQNPETALSFLKIDKNGTAANLIRLLIPSLYEAACLPVYKTAETSGASFEEIAESYGNTLPESDYETFFELAGYIVSSAMAGDENIPAQSVEFRLFWECIKIALVSSLDSLEEEVDEFLSSKSLPFTYTELKDFGSKLAFRKSVVSKLMAFFVLPVIEKVTVDDKNPQDLNMVLPAYGEKAVTLSFSQLLLKIFGFIREFFERLYTVILYY